MKCKVRRKWGLSKRRLKTVTVRLDSKQQKQILDDLTQRIEWSTNRIIDEATPAPQIVPQKKTDAFSILVKVLLCGLFVGFGILGFITIINNWSTVCVGGFANIVAIGTVFVICLACIIIGVDIWREKDRNFLIALFSALVSLVALIVAFLE